MKIYLVGGAVRDKLLGQPVQERDWVIVGATEEDLRKLGYRQVGKEFPVFLHPKTHEEYALARMERKVRPGYQGFTFDTSPRVTLEDDLIRRDLTINAMAESEEGELIDPHQGKADLAAKLLRHVSPAFEEDPVRILRVGRFLARYAHLGFQVAPETIKLMRTMVSKGEVDALVAERVWKELERALTERHPEKFFEVLAECGALSRLFPQLDLSGCGREALITATLLASPPTVRFAALLHGVSAPEESIPALCARYRAPKVYRSLALLTAMHYQTLLRAKTLSAEALLDFFGAVDIYRRPDRFQELMTAAQAIALASHQDFDIEWIKHKVQLVKSINVQAFTEKGLKGMVLAKALREARLKEIEKTG